MKRPARPSYTLALLALLTLGAANARPVALGGIITSPRIETKPLPTGREGLPVWFLERLGVHVLNRPEEIRLTHAGRELRYTPATGWTGTGVDVGALPLPEPFNGSLHVTIEVLQALGLAVLADTPEVLDLAAPTTPPAARGPGGPAPSSSTLASPALASPALGTPSLPPGTVITTGTAGTPATLADAAPVQLTQVRTSRAINRATETQRVVLEFNGPVNYVLMQDPHGVAITVANITAAPHAPGTQTLESGDQLTVTSLGNAVRTHLSTGDGGRSTLLVLDNPPRLVIDTVTQLDPAVTPPPDLASLPDGVTYRKIGKLELLSFDPALFEPRIVTAHNGRADSVYEHVKRTGGIAGVNGGYFDPRSNLPVDLVAQNGLMLAPSLERRATIGFTGTGEILFGTPRPRYALSGPWGATRVNSVRAQPRREWLTLFIGDGRTSVGAEGLVTLVLDSTRIVRVHGGANTPAQGEITLTFDPERYPQLPQTDDVPVTLTLDWAAPGWETVREALAAGPLLVDDGHVAVNAAREGFDTTSNVWRPTRQVAFAIMSGKPTIAYHEYATPDSFARALADHGATRAVRLDSGSSATVYAGGGYFNTVWSRPVPNAIVFVPKAPIAKR